MAPVLTRERIVATAIDLADRDGFEAATLRRIAGELGVHVTSLYNHVPTRDAVTDGMVERLIEEADLPVEPVGWEQWVRSFVARIGDVASRHPGAFGALQRRPVQGPRAAASFEVALAASRKRGLPPRTPTAPSRRRLSSPCPSARRRASRAAASSRRRRWTRPRRMSSRICTSWQTSGRKSPRGRSRSRRSSRGCALRFADERHSRGGAGEVAEGAVRTLVGAFARIAVDADLAFGAHGGPIDSADGNDIRAAADADRAVPRGRGRGSAPARAASAPPPAARVYTGAGARRPPSPSGPPPRSGRDT